MHLNLVLSRRDTPFGSYRDVMFRVSAEKERTCKVWLWLILIFFAAGRKTFLRILPGSVQFVEDFETPQKCFIGRARFTTVRWRPGRWVKPYRTDEAAIYGFGKPPDDTC